MNSLNKTDSKGSNPNTPVDWIKSLWIPVVGFAGAVTAVVQFVQLWRGDREIATWAAVGLGFLVLLSTLIFVAFSTVELPIYLLRIKPSRRPRYPKIYKLSRIALGAIIVVACIAGWELYQRDLALRTKVVILIANFDGPDAQKYRVTDNLISQLRQSLSRYDDYIIELPGETITEQDGSKKARALGNRYRADLVLWGWYGVTESDVLLTIHIENLIQEIALPATTGSYSLSASAAEIEHFQIQQRFSDQMTSFSLFVGGLIRYKADDFTGATERFSDALETGEWAGDLLAESSIYLYRGLSYLFASSSQPGNSASDYIANSIADFSRVIQEFPNSVVAYHNRGQAYGVLATGGLNRGEAFVTFSNSELYQKAILDYGMAIKIDPHYDPAYFSRGSIYILMGELANAMTDFTTLIDKNSDWRIIAHVYRAEIYSIQGEDDKAMNDYTEAINANQPYSLAYIAYIGRGHIYLGRNEYPKALNDFNKAVEVAPKDASAYAGRGDVYMALKQYQRAIGDYSRAIQVDYDVHSQYYYDRASVYFELGEYQKAIDDLEQILGFEILPLPEGYRKRGLAYQHLGNNQQAQDDFLKASQAYIELGVYMRRNYGPEKAIEDFSKAIELNPQNAEAYSMRGLLNFELERYQDAIDDYSRALDLGWQHKDTYFSRGLVFIAMGRYEEAESDLTRVIELDPQSVDAYYFRGKVYVLLNQKQNAIADLKKFLEIGRDSDNYQDAKDALSKLGENQ